MEGEWEGIFQAEEIGKCKSPEGGPCPQRQRRATMPNQLQQKIRDFNYY